MRKHLLSRNEYPFTIRFLDARDRSEIHRIVVDSPGPVNIPGLSEAGTRVVLVETTYATGHQILSGPDGTYEETDHGVVPPPPDVP